MTPIAVFLLGLSLAGAADEPLPGVAARSDG